MISSKNAAGTLWRAGRTPQILSAHGEGVHVHRDDQHGEHSVLTQAVCRLNCGLCVISLIMLYIEKSNDGEM